MCGASRATSSAALDVEAYLLPVVLQIEKQNTHTLGRIMSRQTVPELGGISRVGPAATHAYPPTITHCAIFIGDTKTNTQQTSTPQRQYHLSLHRRGGEDLPHI